MDLREHFFAEPPEIKSETVTLRGVEYAVREMTVSEKDQWERDNADPSNASPRARMVVSTVFGPDGRPVFRKGDAHRLGDYPISMIEPFIDAALRINKVSKEDLETLEKNSNGRG